MDLQHSIEKFEMDSALILAHQRLITALEKEQVVFLFNLPEQEIERITVSAPLLEDLISSTIQMVHRYGKFLIFPSPQDIVVKDYMLYLTILFKKQGVQNEVSGKNHIRDKETHSNNS